MATLAVAVFDGGTAMTQQQNSRCIHCGLSITDSSRDTCPRCSYPTRPSQQIEFLESSLQTLEAVVADGGGDAPLDGLTHLSEATLDELRHLAKYGGANLRLADLRQFSPWVVEGLRRIKLPKGAEMRVPELVYTLEISVQWLRILTAPEWAQVQVAGMIQLSQSTIEQIRQVVERCKPELRVKSLTPLTASTIRDFQRGADYAGNKIKTFTDLLHFYQDRLTYLRSADDIPAQEEQSKKTADLPLPTLHSQPTGDITAQKQKAPEIAPQFTSSPLPAVKPPLPEPEPATPSLVSVHFSLDTPAIAPVRTATGGGVTRPAPVPVSPHRHRTHRARQHRTHRVRQPQVRQVQRAHAGMSEKLKTFIADSRAFITDSKMILTLLGAFLSLMAALFLVVNTLNDKSANSIIIAFVAVVFAQVFFLGASIMTQRYTRFLPIARIYAFVFALLIPMFGFELFNLLGGDTNHVSQQWLIAIVSLYTAISFCLFAIYQKYQPFGYFGMVALWGAAIATANALNVGFEWYPALLMLLALPSLISVHQHVSSATPDTAPVPDSTTIKVERLMAASPVVLRRPVKYCMYFLVALCSVSIIPLAIVSFNPQSAGITGSGIAASIAPGQVRFALFCMFALLLIWYSLYLWLAKKQTGQLGVAWLLLFSSLAFGYSLQFSPVGYALLLVGLAILYHVVGTRLIVSPDKPASSRKIASPERLSLRLDQFALIFICLVPFINAPVAMPLFFKRQVPGSLSFLPAFLQSYSPLLSSSALLTLLALFSGTVLTVSIAIHRNALALARKRSASNSAGQQVKSGWPWLLLLAGLLLCWNYSVLIVNLPGAPAWWFLGLALALVAITVVVRHRTGSSWANPLDVVVLCVAITTILLNIQNSQAVSNLLLFFAALSYVILLLQQRQKALFLPLLFALLALPILYEQLPAVSLAALLAVSNVLVHPPVILLCALTLPFVAALVYYLKARKTSSLAVAPCESFVIGWQWPITCFSLLCACILLYHDAIAPSISFNSPAISPAISIQIVLLSLVWYARAALTRDKWLLFPVTIFAIAPLLLNMTNFWLLVAITVVAALSGSGISRLSRGIWAAPLYTVALLGAALTGIAGNNQTDAFLSSAAWVLLGFVVIVHIVAIVERRTLLLWLAPALTTWSVIDTLIFQHSHITLFPQNLLDLARVPGVALVCVSAGVAIGLAFRRANTVPAQRSKRLQYTAPLYTSALIAAILTGCYALYLETNYPAISTLIGTVSLALSALLLLYSVIASGVSLFERQAHGGWLVAGFGIWGILLTMQINLYLVVGIGIVTGIVGLTIGRFKRLKLATVTSRPDAMDILLPAVKYFLKGYKATTTGLGDALKIFTWSWPWYLMTVVAAVVTGLRPYLGMVSPANGAIEYSLLAFAALIYIIGYYEKQALIAFFATSFSVWAFLNLAGFTLYAFNFSAPARSQLLVALSLLCLSTGIAMRLPGFRARGFPARTVTMQQDRTLRFTLPVYFSAFAAALLTAIAPHDLSSFLPEILLDYALISYSVIVFEQRPGWLFIPAGFAAWGTLLLSQNATLLVIGLVAAPVGMHIRQRLSVPAPGLQSIWQKLLHTWAWPWYTTALIAAITTGLHPQTTGEWLSPANSLLVFAALAYAIGLVEDLVLWLWIGPVLALWSLLDSFTSQPPDPLRLISMALICVLLGVVVRRSSFLFKQRARKRFIYVLPFYATALAAAILTGLYSITVKTMAGIPLVSQYLPSVQAPTFYGIILLVYTLVAFLVLFFEKRALWLALVAAFGIWATILVSPANPAYVLAIGLTGGVCGLLLSRAMKVTPSGVPLPASLQSFLQPFIRFTWSWPWYGIALLAAIITGISQPSLTTANTLLLFAALACIIGLVEDQPGILYVAVVFVIWSAHNSSSHDDLLRLFLDTVCSVAVAIAVGLYARLRFHLDQRRILLRYILPLYALALYVAVLTGLTGTLAMIPAAFPAIILPGGSRLSDASLILLLYSVLAYGILRLERLPLGTAIVAFFGLWGTILAIRTGTSPILLLSIGLGAGLMGVAHAWRAFARVSVPVAPLFDETLNIDNI